MPISAKDNISPFSLKIYIYILIFSSIIQTATEEDISYSPANTKEKDGGQNGNYIGMTTKTEQ